MNKPFFSIVVASLNAGNLIKSTIDSILSQTFKNYEIIVKDGVSSDDTLSYIPDHPSIKVYSQKDTGIYDGMNQGIGYCSGEYIFFLNCGDVFHSNTVLEDIHKHAVSANNPCILYGNHTRGNTPFQPSLKIKAFSLYRSSICHQALFTHREIFDKIGLYKTEYKISADYDHIVHAFFSGFPFVYCPVTIINYLPGGVSESKKGRAISDAEYAKIRSDYYSPFSRFRYDLILALSLTKFRRYILSSSSPEFIKKIYRFTANKVRKFL